MINCTFISKTHSGDGTIRQLRVRIILPVIYVIISGGLLAGCFLHLGHSSWCQYFLNSMQPAGFVDRVLSHAFVSWGIVRQDSEAAKILDGVLTVPLPLV